jgi:glycerol-3-phosphate dehydrogenase
MVPSEKGKGVLISPTTSGNYLVGPSAYLVARDEKSTDKATLNKVKQQANYMIENIPYYETIRTFAGLRATPSTHDFIIEESKTENFINVVGIESPGLASSPAIAKMVVEDILAKKLELVKKDSFNPYVKKYVKLKNMSIEDRQEYFKENKDYGTIVCKCEQVSKGEIIDCLNRSCPPRSIKGLKRRLRVGFGKCQGGMCQSVALEILADFYKVDKKEIPYDNKNAFILLKKTKGEE